MTIEINHRPMFNTEEVERLYTEKDGVDVRYVCTTSLNREEYMMDIFYRDTPHPEFGNRYFGLYVKSHPLYGRNIVITNADGVEDVEFEMVSVNGAWHYSRHVHDFYSVGNVSIDGGREYLRLVGDASHPVKTFVVRDGEFVEKTR